MIVAGCMQGIDLMADGVPTRESVRIKSGRGEETIDRPSTGRPLLLARVYSLRRPIYDELYCTHCLLPTLFFFFFFLFCCCCCCSELNNKQRYLHSISGGKARRDVTWWAAGYHLQYPRSPTPLLFNNKAKILFFFSFSHCCRRQASDVCKAARRKIEWGDTKKLLALLVRGPLN